MIRGTNDVFGSGADDHLLGDMQLEVAAESDRLGIQCTVDLWFYVFLRSFSRFGYFNFGPITIDVRMIADIIERTGERIEPGERAYGDDFVRFSLLVADERRRSGQRRIDELHLLLAFMRVEDGLVSRVFGELGVTRNEVEEFARRGGRPNSAAAALGGADERLYSPEDAAEYLGVHAADCARLDSLWTAAREPARGATCPAHLGARPSIRAGAG